MEGRAQGGIHPLRENDGGRERDAVPRRMPCHIQAAAGIKKEWQLSWCDDSTDGFRNIDLHFKENAVPGQIVELYRKQREEDAAHPPSSFWGRMKYIFRHSLRKRCVILSAHLC